ncbi:temptin [Patella vulgata]|uniref:temptin n=1 Tax=Patella vulgata TaxID=6465 RepID=UPI00217F7AA6|nr:temptin [Patella vulgata]
MFTCVILFINLFVAVSGLFIYRERIPNGDSVPNPCGTGGIWNGVGHYNQNGGGTLNPFGLEFSQNYHMWTIALCNADSDGDGKTNGEELGDPFCDWTQGVNINHLKDTTGHPGICEPIGSPLCATQEGKFSC